MRCCFFCCFAGGLLFQCLFLFAKKICWKGLTDLFLETFTYTWKNHTTFMRVLFLISLFILNCFLMTTCVPLSFVSSWTNFKEFIFLLNFLLFHHSRALLFRDALLTMSILKIEKISLIFFHTKSNLKISFTRGIINLSSRKEHKGIKKVVISLTQFTWHGLANKVGFFNPLFPFFYLSPGHFESITSDEHFPKHLIRPFT